MKKSSLLLLLLLGTTLSLSAYERQTIWPKG